MESAPASRAYDNPAFRTQATGGSTSVRTSWEPLRRAGASARAMLVAAAAEQWQVPASECASERGQVVHRPSGRHLRYGELVDAAARQPVPRRARLKDPSEFRIIGTRVPRLDNRPKVDGTGVFGLDVTVPGLLVATVARCPVFGGRMGRYDATAALTVAGVRRVVPIQSGVAVVADGFWSAKLGRDALRVEWDTGGGARASSEGIRAECLAALRAPGGDRAASRGDAAEALGSAAHRLEAVYEFPSSPTPRWSR